MPPKKCGRGWTIPPQRMKIGSPVKGKNTVSCSSGKPYPPSGLWSGWRTWWVPCPGDQGCVPLPGSGASPLRLAIVSQMSVTRHWVIHFYATKKQLQTHLYQFITLKANPRDFVLACVWVSLCVCVCVCVVSGCACVHTLCVCMCLSVSVSLSLSVYMCVCTSHVWYMCVHVWLLLSQMSWLCV